MQIKTINKTLKAKIEEWAESVTDPIVKKAILNDSIITGGCIASMLLSEDINDYDVYMRTKESCRLVAEYYSKMTDGQVKTVYSENIGEVFSDESSQALKTEHNLTKWSINNAKYLYNLGQREQSIIFVSNMEEDQVKLFIPDVNFYEMPEEKISGDLQPEKVYKPKFFSANAITLSDDLQIVIRFWGEPEEIHKNYDFVHATNYFDSKEGKLTTRKEALESLLSKQLIYIGSKYPVTSVIRTKKFLKRGWNVSASTYLKMIFQCSELNLSDPKTLQEQLIGVDVAYFQQLLAILHTDKESQNITYDRISELLNNIAENI